jgi:anti-sigma factor RsiW
MSREYTAITAVSPALPSPPLADALTCQQVVELLVEYVAGDMDAPTQAVFEVHLRDCAACVSFLATYRETLRATRAVRYDALPDALLTRVQQFLQRWITGASHQA